MHDLLISRLQSCCAPSAKPGAQIRRKSPNSPKGWWCCLFVCSRSLGFGDEGINQSSLFGGIHFGERHVDLLSLLERTDKFNRQIQQTNMTPWYVLQSLSKTMSGHDVLCLNLGGDTVSQALRFLVALWGHVATRKWERVFFGFSLTGVSHSRSYRQLKWLTRSLLLYQSGGFFWQDYTCPSTSISFWILLTSKFKVHALTS